VGSGGGGSGEDAGKCTPDAGETDTGCGGPICPHCPIGGHCATALDCVGGNCVGNVCTCPLGMVHVPVPAGNGVYCIDAVEVTNAEYEVFFGANPPLATQPSFCSWNTGYTPSATATNPTETCPNWLLTANQPAPVGCVNWCQAEDYCSWAGKRLCGMIGGGSASITNAAVAMSDQWYNACSAQGAQAYPYGDTYSPLTCNGVGQGDGGLGMPWQEQSNMSCVGGVPAVYDMSGNVAEWEDACDGTTGMSDNCLVRGGSFESNAAQLMCDAVPTQARSYTGPDVGFRCCL